MTLKEKFALTTAAICVGMLIVVLLDCGLRYFEWAMLAIGGNFR